MKIMGNGYEVDYCYGNGLCTIVYHPNKDTEDVVKVFTGGRDWLKCYEDFKKVVEIIKDKEKINGQFYVYGVENKNDVMVNEYNYEIRIYGFGISVKDNVENKRFFTYFDNVYAGWDKWLKMMVVDCYHNVIYNHVWRYFIGEMNHDETAKIVRESLRKWVTGEFEC